MGHEIRYCDRCAQLVSPGDLRTGRGIATDDLVLCVSCAQRLTAADRAGAREPVVPAGATPAEDNRPRARPGPDRSAHGTQARTFGIAVAAGAVVSILVAVSVLRDRGRPAATNRAHRVPVSVAVS